MNPTESASRLRVTLVISAGTVDILSRDATLGRWTCDDVRAFRHEGNWFRLDIENEDWRFLPDAPTEFLFFGVPLIAGTRPSRRRWHLRPRYDTTDLSSIGRIALGATLAALLVSIGMLIGRYQLDDSRVTVLTVLFAGGALGAWWTSASRRPPSSLARTNNAKRPLVLPSNQRHSALSVREVMADSRVDSKESATDVEASDPPPETVVSDSTEPIQSAAPVDLEPSTPVDSIVHIDISDDHTTTAEPLSSGPAPSSREPDRGAQRTELDLRSSDDPATPTKLHDADSDSSTPESSPEPVMSVEPVLAGAAHAEPASAGESVARARPRISVSELLEFTADIEGTIDLTDRALRRDDGVAPIDLTAIRGIGPVLSAGLTRLGVSDVQRLAVLTTDDQAYVGRRLGRFASPDRMRDWVEQARRIVADLDVTDDA